MEPIRANAVEPQSPLADLVELARPDASLAREPQQLQQLLPKAERDEDQEAEQQQQRARFAEIVLPLEQKARRRLKDQDRSVCYRCFVDYPEGFAEVVDDLLDRSDVKYPIALLVHCVEAGDPAEAQGLHEQRSTQVVYTQYTQPNEPTQPSETPTQPFESAPRLVTFKCSACPFEAEKSNELDEHVHDVHEASCVVCDSRETDLVYRGGQWWCQLHGRTR
jgi:hypothetical protein